MLEGQLASCQQTCPNDRRFLRSSAARPALRSNVCGLRSSMREPNRPSRYFAGSKFNATPLMQYRSPVGGGPSSKT